MKRLLIWSGVFLVVGTVGFALARTASPTRYEWRHRGPAYYVAHQLGLSATQKSQIASIWQGEKPVVASLVREYSAENKEMDAATVQGKLDQSRVQEIADRQGATIAKLLVEKEKLRSQVYATVLTAEQRAKADKLQERWQSRFDRIASRLELPNDSSAK